MPGHLAVPALEPDPSVPATTSRNILTGLLRDELKFKGLVVTDAMDMGGVTSRYPPGEAAVRAVEAGADVLLMPPVPDAAMAGLEQAVRSGRITEKRIDESVRRILQAKSRLGLDKNRLGGHRAPGRKIRAAGICGAGAEYRGPRGDFAARQRATAAAGSRRNLSAYCWYRFPPTPIRIREKPSSRKFAGAWIR